MSARFIPFPGMLEYELKFPTTALIAMLAVPSVAIRLCTSIFPMWNTVLSIPAGIAILSILLIMAGEMGPFDRPIMLSSSLLLYIRANIITPTAYFGPIISLCLEKRGVQTNMNYLDEKRVELIYEMPLAEVLFDFYDRLKSISRGYASFDYEVIGYKATDLVRMDILVNGDSVDALSQLVFKDNAYTRGRQVCQRLKDEIPRQQFKIAIQAAIGGNIIARETISAYRKDVTAKCYGGDISRKRKLLEKQKEGKKRMKMVGNVEIPQSAFLAVLKTEGEKD